MSDDPAPKPRPVFAYHWGCHHCEAEGEELSYSATVVTAEGHITHYHDGEDLFAYSIAPIYEESHG